MARAHKFPPVAAGFQNANRQAESRAPLSACTGAHASLISRPQGMVAGCSCYAAGGELSLSSPPAPALAKRAPTADEAMGMKWWNGLTQPERRWVFAQTDQLTPGQTAAIADAWALWKAGRISMTPTGCGSSPALSKL